MSDRLTKRLQNQIVKRMRAEGGFSEHDDGDPRPDATAWSIIALANSGGQNQELDRSRQMLVSRQSEDGRIALAPAHPEAFWPTALVSLALQGDPAYHASQNRAIQFLIEASGTHAPRPADSPLCHDSSIPGWPWVDATHSWVEPTALALLALIGSGHGSHPRARHATQLLLDRQLPSGGWNYGNTCVFGQELRPMPDSTGIALQALAGRAETTQVEPGLTYLEAVLDRTRTPFSLGWGLLGLSAWGRRPAHAPELIEASLQRQSFFGEYPTTHLSLLLLAATAVHGLTGSKTTGEESHLDG